MDIDAEKQLKSQPEYRNWGNKQAGSSNLKKKKCCTMIFFGFGNNALGQTEYSKWRSCKGKNLKRGMYWSKTQ